ncbi:MAG: Sua5/YciO/YrdC/YwlC family protein [Alphaproteobacteria bacterium]
MSDVAVERLTSDPVPADRLRADVSRMMDVLAEGGVALVPLDVAYGIVAMREAGIRKIFTAKQRSYEKPSGMFSNAALSREIHIMDPAKHDMVDELIAEERIPFSVVAPFRVDHPLFRAVDPFVLQSSTKIGTIDMLLNAGQFHDEIARQVAERGRPVFGSSANTSLTGSKYRLADIDAPVRAAADVSFDYGLSKYANPEGRSSTIVDFRDFTVVRKGVCFEQLARAFMARFKVEIRLVPGVTAGL